jgi:hypothetical protein
MADYYSVIATAVSRLPNKTDEARRAIYDRARTALQDALRDCEPTMLENEQAALDDAIHVLEVVNDIHDTRHSLREEAAVPHPS